MNPSLPASNCEPVPVVYLVDDEEVVREGLAWLLRSRRLLSEAFASGDAFVEFLDGAGGASAWPAAPSCLLLDVRMPGRSGLAVFESMGARGLLSVLPVIFLTGHGDVPMAVSSVKAGAFDFVEKPFSNNALVDRVEQALQSSARALRRRSARHSLARTLSELTEREREVMELVTDGLPNKQIAEVLQISVRTVEVHRARIFEKMNVRSAVELANLLREPAAEEPRA